MFCLALAAWPGAWGCTCQRDAGKQDDQADQEPALDSPTPIYALDVVPELHLSLDARAMDKLAKKPRKYVRGQLRQGDATYADVAIRLKGHRSMRKLNQKPAFKLRFDKYDPDGRFLGLKKLTLNNMVEDQTMLREILGYRLYRKAGVVAPQVGYATVFLNGQRKGLYSVVETVDDKFLARNFDDAGGNLYEGEYGCDLYSDDVPGFEHDEGPAKEPQDRVALAALAQVAGGEASALFGSSSPLDMKNFLNYLAVSMYIGDFDGYRHSHNYRIYHEPTRDKWYFIPWGIDRIFKKHISIYDSQGLLAKRCFAHPPCRLDYLRTLRQVIGHTAELDLAQAAKVVSTVIERPARADEMKPYSDNKVARYRRRMMHYLRKRPVQVEKQLACLDAEGNEIDGDGDGHGCMDCNDEIPDIHPEASEVCNGRDDNCSGLADDDPACPCPSHDIGGHTFHFCNLPMTWVEAAEFCAAQGLELARIDSVAQSEALYARAFGYERQRWWIGYSDRKKEGEFVWRDGSKGTFTHWARGEPDNDACNQDCAALKEKKGGVWHDTHCAQMRPFICRGPASSKKKGEASPKAASR